VFPNTFHGQQVFLSPEAEIFLRTMFPVVLLSWSHYLR